MSYLEELNEEQRKAVENTEGPVMVIAGAGSGKTRVLTYRIAHLINKGVDPFQILALTFTNKAAKEMKERIVRITSESDAKSLWMGTFHSVFSRILRSEAEKIGYPSHFSIYNTDDSKNLLKDIIKGFNLDDKQYKTNMVFSRISAAKNNLISANAYINDKNIQAEDTQRRLPEIGRIYLAYEQRCSKASAMDFDDLLFKTNILLRDFPEVLYKYQSRFKYILVDEYQDTNYSQYLIVKKLAARFQNICVVGDDAQSIYAFRGANIQNILNFQKDYSDAQTFKLEQNYRSTKSIVNTANRIITFNKEQLPKEVWTDNENGEKIKVFQTLTDKEEGETIASGIYSRHLSEHAPFSDFAILYRTNAQSRSFEEALRKRNIPYRIFGGISFYQRKEIKDLLAYFRLVINPNDEESFKRIINYPLRGIGKTSIEKIMVLADQHQVSLWDIASKASHFGNDFNTGLIQKINEFITTIKSFSTLLFTQNAYELGNQIAQTSGILKELFSDTSPEGVSRYENIVELLNGLKEFVEDAQKENPKIIPTLDEYMQEIALLTDADKESEEDKNTVSLMTIHMSKGLEFGHVYIVGLEEGLFPSQLSTQSRTDLEEERRLFYVALTRAQKSVTLSYALTRYRWGQLTQCEPSRFLEELDSTYVEILPKQEANKKNNETFFTKHPTNTAPTPAQNPIVRTGKSNLVKLNSAISKSTVTAQDLNLRHGMQVHHEKFGKGKVLNIEGASPNQKATIEFESVGNKQLLLKFARLTIVETDSLN
ncbi:MAG: UvrD-helicase domain-containing protein [Bacteroidetes bacterium]|nr:ATP-dependent DNA helicase [Bacteroidota bacterium]MBV6461930.1 ATP-dependent DNA helicase PcrA [Flavobacteriales bacterium]WKZ74497.1 MAG: 3'-5' exonuclease [Vicingaceae bacterium]NOG95111.1 UvrD-helicase domain-containing protein [Bacteroidota bacterium]CAG0953690.1 ATP-dependent DNA helicase PcrA [Flavobacteriales bacterium]